MGNIPAQMGYSSSTTSKANWSQFQYSQTSKVTMGLAVNGTAEKSGFSVGGTVTTSTGSSTGGKYTFPREDGAVSYNYTGTAVYDDDEIECAPTPDTHWNMNFNNVGLVRNSLSASSVTATHCSNAGAGNDQFTQGTYKTFGVGVDLKAAGFNVNVSSQTGLTTSSSLTYDLNASGHICGTTNVPNYLGTPIPGELEVRN